MSAYKYYVVPVAKELAERVEEGIVTATVQLVPREDGLTELRLRAPKVPQEVLTQRYEKLTDEELEELLFDFIDTAKQRQWRFVIDEDGYLIHSRNDEPTS